MRVVLYAEGPKETGTEGFAASARHPVLAEEILGPAHVLARRCIVRVSKADIGSIRFLRPKPDQRGRVVRGSQLLDARTLRPLLMWAIQENRPELAIVLIDADGAASERRRALHAVVAHRSGWQPPAVIAIAVEEFESWLLADVAPLGRGLGRQLGTLDLKSWKAREAKAWFENQLSELGSEERWSLRLDICRQCDLKLLSYTSESFKRFLDDLRRAIKAIA